MSSSKSGMSRAHLRSSVWWKSVIIAVFGTLGGLGITFPAFSLGFIVLLAALAGLRPALRAAKLDILNAIATE